LKITRKHIILFLSGACFAFIVASMGVSGLLYSSKTSFCILCHEMKVVSEQGWKYSSHYSNDQGVVAQCEDCHIPPELFNKLWTKARDGAKDIAVHTFGESDPEKMPWEELAHSARAKISDSACLKCHENLTPKGAKIKTIIAHRAYLRLKGQKKCLDCHREQFHGRFRERLSDNNVTNVDGG